METHSTNVHSAHTVDISTPDSTTCCAISEHIPTWIVPMRVCTESSARLAICTVSDEEDHAVKLPEPTIPRRLDQYRNKGTVPG